MFLPIRTRRVECLPSGPFVEIAPCPGHVAIGLCAVGISQPDRARARTRARSSVIDARPGSTALVALTLITAPAPAAADGFCAAVERQDAQAHTLAAEANAALSSASTGTCSVTRSLSAPDGSVCQWEFDYRGPAAAQAFDRFTRLLSDCFQGRAREIRDQGVNHPDFYDLRQYRLDNAAVSVSIKDKGALRKTFVFLRIEPNGQNN